MPENDLLAQHQRALGILCGLHPSVAVDGAPEDVAVRIFRHTQAERTLLQERVSVLEDTIQLLTNHPQEAA